MTSVVFKIKVVYLFVSKLEKDTTCDVWCSSRLNVRLGQVDEIVASFSRLAADLLLNYWYWTVSEGLKRVVDYLLAGCRRYCRC